jgi:hypothetical protein
VIALQELMGHTRIETTLVYLRRKDRAKAMEQVRKGTISRRVGGLVRLGSRQAAIGERASLLHPSKDSL